MAKILLVEDDDNLREIYEARLLAEGYEIVTARNGEDALVVAKENKPDLIISDVMMPNISGFDMLDILRNTQGLHDAKVIMLTALSQADDKIRAEKLGADRYLVKSQVTLEDIVNAAAELLGGNSAEPESAPIATEQALPLPEPILAPEIPVSSPADTATSAPSFATTAPLTPEPVAEPAQQPPMPVVVEPAQIAVTTEPTEPAFQATTSPVESPTVIQPAPLFSDPVVQPTQITPVVEPPQDTTQFAATVAEPVIVPQPDTQAQPASIATSTIPVVEAPELTEETPNVISMPSQSTTVQPSAPSSDEQPVNQPVPAAPLDISTPAVAPPAVEVTKENSQTEPTGNDTSATDQPTTLDFDPTHAQTVTSEGAAIQQQIDNFVSSAPITTPEFNPASFEATNEAGVPEVASETTNTAPVEPSTAPNETPMQPQVELAVPIAAAHTPTGGNKIIQPLVNGPAVAGPSLDELLAAEEASANPTTNAPVSTEQQPLVPAPPVQTQQPVQAPAQPPSQVQPPQTTVFDPADPSSVSL